MVAICIKCSLVIAQYMLNTCQANPGYLMPFPAEGGWNLIILAFPGVGH